jgi:hypothetical protein
MVKSQLDASTFGVGELITQRKRFAVPEHQRNYAWPLEAIEKYLTDVASAFERNAPDYFIGLVVLQGPIEGLWQILDGQQRLATTTMVFSAIRDWFLRNHLEVDAKQIETEFIGVRQLGGSYSPRLRLNIDNREIFQRFIVDAAPTEKLYEELAKQPKKSSNFLLLDGALYCREWIAKYAETASTTGSSAALFELSSYYESKVKTVCVDVSSQTDAYILFEALNDRGTDLSALDLVKNYVFSEIKSGTDDRILDQWRRMAENIEDKDADDFLKVFWTSKFGIIQKLDLFDRLRQTYPAKDGASKLVEELADASEKFEALDDPDHELWIPYGWVCRQRIQDLKVLGSRQSRALILGALTYLPSSEVASFLWLLVVTIVRYQLIGRGRTGILEKEFAALAMKIHRREVQTAEQAYRNLEKLIPDDSAFRQAFAIHAEGKSSRVEYLLLELEATARSRQGSFGWEDYVLLRSSASQISPRFLISPLTANTEEEESILYRIGNRVLVEETLDLESTMRAVAEVRDRLAESTLTLTSDVAQSKDWTISQVFGRSEKLAHLAAQTWIFENSLLNLRRDDS